MLETALQIENLTVSAKTEEQLVSPSLQSLEPTVSQSAGGSYPQLVYGASNSGPCLLVPQKFVPTSAIRCGLC